MPVEAVASGPDAFARLRASVSFRLLVPAALVLLLQIPVALIDGTIAERRTTKGAAFAEVAATWGGPQQIAGPVLTLLAPAAGSNAQPAVPRQFLPRTLILRGRVDTETRRRGIFDVPLYVARLHVEGTFVLPAGALPERASVSVGLSDAKAIRAA